MSQIGKETEVGLEFAGGTIFATVNSDGFRNAEASTNLVDFVEREFPYLKVRISRPAAVGYTGLSENIELSTLEGIRQAALELLKRPYVSAIAMSHGSDFPEVTGSYLANDPEVMTLLKEKAGEIHITYSNDPFPAQEAKNNLEAAILAADRRDHAPGVYITTEHGTVPIAGARKETFSGRSMRFFDYYNPGQKALEDQRRFNVFVTANELAQKLSYPGIFAMIAKALPHPDNVHPGQWTATIPGPYKTATLEDSSHLTNQRDAFLTAVLSHALDREQITPFPGHSAFLWPVNRPADPFSVETIIQGFSPEVQACILILNHSSTAHTLNPDLSIATAAQRLRAERNITTFAVTENGEPTRFGEGSYITSRDLRNAGVVPLPMHSKVAWVKMWAAMDQGLQETDLIDFMTTQVHPDEFTGKPDYDSIQFAKELVKATPTRQLRLPGYGTGYLVVPRDKWDSVRLEPRRI